MGEGLTRWGCYGDQGTEIQGIFWIRMNAFMGWSSEVIREKGEVRGNLDSIKQSHQPHPTPIKPQKIS